METVAAAAGDSRRVSGKQKAEEVKPRFFLKGESRREGLRERSEIDFFSLFSRKSAFSYFLSYFFFFFFIASTSLCFFLSIYIYIIYCACVIWGFVLKFSGIIHKSTRLLVQLQQFEYYVSVSYDRITCIYIYFTRIGGVVVFGNKRVNSHFVM